MTAFAIGKPVTTTTPTVTVDGLPAGVHRFRLEVLAKDRRRSHAVTVVVKVVAARPPIGPVGPLPDVLQPHRPPVVEPVRERIVPVVPVRRPRRGSQDPSE